MPTKITSYYITKTTNNKQKVSIVCMYSKRHVSNQNLLNLEMLSNLPLHAASLDHGRRFCFANIAWSIRFEKTARLEPQLVLRNPQRKGFDRRR